MGLVCVSRAAIALSLLVSGGVWLGYTTEIDELMLNSVALEVGIPCSLRLNSAQKGSARGFWCVCVWHVSTIRWGSVLGSLECRRVHLQGPGAYEHPAEGEEVTAGEDQEESALA